MVIEAKFNGMLSTMPVTFSPDEEIFILFQWKSPRKRKKEDNSQIGVELHHCGSCTLLLVKWWSFLKVFFRSEIVSF